jgi:SAM-dependent methyltransferase
VDALDRYLLDRLRCDELGGEPAFPMVEREPRYDDNAPAGATDIHYTAQDVWVAQQVLVGLALEHLDVGSRFDGFVTHLLAGGVDVTYVDSRPLGFEWPHLLVVQDDARELASIESESFESVSCLHALEHFGLGRYGDEVDPDGWRRGIAALARVTAPGGKLYLSVPVGQQRREGNWHRVFEPGTIRQEVCSHGFTICDFAVVDDAGTFHAKHRPEAWSLARYACGIFVFRKEGAP